LYLYASGDDMKRDLIQQRDRASALYDSILAQYPERLGEPFIAGMSQVIAELTRIIEAAEPRTSDPVEWARTAGWLGSAHHDLSLAYQRDPDMLMTAARWYSRAEEMIEGVQAPLVKATISFNFANTLQLLVRQDDPEGSVARLESAQHRFEQALRVFRTSHASDLVTRAEQMLSSLRPELVLIREWARRAASLASMQKLGAAMDATDDLREKERLLEEMRRIDEQPTGAHVFDAIVELGEQMAALANEYPERFAGADGQRELAAVAGVLDDLQTKLTQAGSAAPSDLDKRALDGLKALLEERAAAENVPPERAQQYQAILDRMEALLKRPKDGESLLGTHAAIKEMAARTTELTGDRRNEREAAAHGRQKALLKAIRSLRQHAITESSRSTNPERRAIGQLSTELEQACESLEDEAPLEERAWQALNRRLWSIARRMRRLARSSHLLPAHPTWTTAARKPSLNSVFISGPQAAAALAPAARLHGWELLTEPTAGQYGEQRWAQILSSDVGVFHLRSAPSEKEPDREDRRIALAQTCYELGLALATGMSLVVAEDPDVRRAPFNIPVQALRLTGTASDGPALEGAVVAAAFDVTWGAGARGDDATMRATHRHVADRYAVGLDAMAETMWESVIAAMDTPSDYADRLARFFEIRGGYIPELVLPAFPPRHAQRDEWRCFHATPFRDWSRVTGEVIRALCEPYHPDGYTRGDERIDQRIIPSIWSDICAAKGVIVDLTGLNANVALELGLCDALGKPTLLIFHERFDPDGLRAERLFPSIDKHRIHAYHDHDDHRSLRKAVGAFLASLVVGPSGAPDRP
jgi:hypothetical protein